MPTPYEMGNTGYGGTMAPGAYPVMPDPMAGQPATALPVGGSMFGAAPPPGGMFGPAPTSQGMFSGFRMPSGTELVTGLQDAMPWMAVAGATTEEAQMRAMGGALDYSLKASEKRKKEEEEARKRKALSASMSSTNAPADLQTLVQDYPEIGVEWLSDRFKPADAGKWASDGEGGLYNTVTAERKGGPSGPAPLFRGTSVEAQSLNHLVEAGRLTPDEAAELGAGKIITDPESGRLLFMTPQGLMSKPAPMQGGGVSTQGGAAPVPASPAGSGASSLGVGSSQGLGVGTARPGQIPLTEGKPAAKPTESQLRDRKLTTVLKPELAVVEKEFGELAKIGNQVAAGFGMPGNYAVTPGYQKARNSVQTIVASYLYSISGATANPGEVATQSEILMPKPGDRPETIAAKKARIKTMVEAVETSGFGAGPDTAAGIPSGWTDLPNGARIRPVQ